MKKSFRFAPQSPSRLLDKKLASYLGAAGAVGGSAGSAQAAIVANTDEQPFGINQEVDIDFNSDGQIDFQIDHDRVDLGGSIGELDYLQIDKNDVTSESNPTDLPNLFGGPGFAPGPTDTAAQKYVTSGSTPYTANIGSYPAALTEGTVIGPGSQLDFQENADIDGSGLTIRANRLIDEDATQIDQQLGGLTPADVQVPFNGPNFVGLNGEVRYLGLEMDLFDNDDVYYGWIGIRIDNEEDATGAVVGFGYNDVPGAPIAAGQIPEPSTLMAVFVGGATIVGFLWRKLFR